MRNHHVKYLVVGGGVASSEAIQAIRAHDREGSILLAAQEVNRPYDRKTLSGSYLAGLTPRESLFTLDAAWFNQHHVELRTCRHASGLDPNRHMVAFDTGEEVLFDKLLIATGASSKHLQIPGAELPNVHYLRGLDDSDRLHHAILKAQKEGRPHQRGKGRAAIIGGGVLGTELAATFTKLGLAVDLITASATPWPKFVGPQTGAYLANLLQSHGVTVHLNSPALRLEGAGRVQRVVMHEEKRIDCDFAVAAIGVVPNKSILRGTSLASEQAVLVDVHGRTSDPNIFAAGDCAAIFDPRFGKYQPLALWDMASITGKLVGRNMAGLNQPYDAVATLSSQLFDVPIRVYGAARLVERRVIRGGAEPDSPGFVEIGVAADGRVAQVIAVGGTAEDPRLVKLVRTRATLRTDLETP